jgi:hypothetical protein
MPETQRIEILSGFFQAYAGKLPTEELVDIVLHQAARNFQLEYPLSPATKKLFEQICHEGMDHFLAVTIERLTEGSTEERLSAAISLYSYLGRNLSFRGYHGFTDQLDNEFSQIIAKAAQSADQVRCVGDSCMLPALYMAAKSAANHKLGYVTLRVQSEKVGQITRVLSAIAGTEDTLNVSVGRPFEQKSSSGWRAADLEVFIFPPDANRRTEIGPLPDSLMQKLGLDTPTARGKVRLDVNALAMADAQLHASGKVLIVTLDGSLSRTVGIEGISRENLIESGRLLSVTQMPSGTGWSGSSVTGCVISLSDKSRKKDEVSFYNLAKPEFLEGSGRLSRPRKDLDWAGIFQGSVELTEDACSRTTIQKVKKNHFILSPQRYTIGTHGTALKALWVERPTSPLGSLCEIIRPRFIRPSEQGDFSVMQVSPADIDVRGMATTPDKNIVLDEQAHRAIAKEALQANDILLSVKGTIGVTGIVPEFTQAEKEGGRWIASQSLVILRVNSELITAEALYEYLSSDMLQQYLKSLASATNIPMIGSKDLKALPVLLPSADELQNIQAKRQEVGQLHDKIQAMQIEINMLKSQTWPSSYHKDA